MTRRPLTTSNRWLNALDALPPRTKAVLLTLMVVIVVVVVLFWP